MNLMKALVEKAQREPSFMAYALRRYMEIQRITEHELEEYLGCSGVNFLRLALCGRPQIGAPEFKRDVCDCALYTGARETALANLLNVVGYWDRVAASGAVAARAVDVSDPPNPEAALPLRPALAEKQCVYRYRVAAPRKGEKDDERTGDRTGEPEGEDVQNGAPRPGNERSNQPRGGRDDPAGGTKRRAHRQREKKTDEREEQTGEKADKRND